MEPFGPDVFEEKCKIAECILNKNIWQGNVLATWWDFPITKNTVMNRKVLFPMFSQVKLPVRQTEGNKLFSYPSHSKNVNPSLLLTNLNLEAQLYITGW